LFFLLLLIFSCSKQNYTSVSNKSTPKAYNFASIYNPAKAPLIFSHSIYIKSDSSADVYFDIDFVKANFNKNNQQTNIDDKQFYIKYLLRKMNNEFVDSSTYKYNLKDFTNFSNYFTVKLLNKEQYKITIAIYDKQYRFSHRLVSFIDNSTKYSQNNYLLEKLDTNSVEILHNNYIISDNKYKIICKNTEKLSIEYFRPIEYIFNPPYQFNITKKNAVIVPDTTFYYITNDTIVFKEIGNYIIKNTSTGQIIFNILNSSDSYPEITTVGNMLEPLKIITTEREYKKISQNENIKQTIDEYWLSLSNSQKLAKEQIRVFYNRVKLANIFFAEDIDGWKTDRGMIYVLFGPPSVINLSDQGEDWYYGENPNVAAILFVFEKKESKSTKISYQLLRDNAYQPTWAQALSVWRKGRIFSL
ncbi:MAG: GWxTD domain-containing protein, partial [Bacteroidales bacterium]|nr:GWxTD domain-containing protein [Bacteroidales bacterium]